MANNFKSDDSFLRKLVLGAAGTNETIKRLRNMGFEPVELERGSTSFKIWKKIKIKRVRVPDILCLKTGLRFESRGKTSPEISMSHSMNDPKRSWNAGMRDDDYVSIVVFQQEEESPVDVTQVSPVHFISVRAMREAYEAGLVSVTKPKGVEEGSEVRLIWKSAAAKWNAVCLEVGATKMVLRQSDSPNSRQTIWLTRRQGRTSMTLVPQVRQGQDVDKNQIVAAAIPLETTLTCPERVEDSYFIEKLTSASLSERYAAAKALRYRPRNDEAKTKLNERMSDPDEDIYVQLEAAAALAAHDAAEGWEFLVSRLAIPARALPNIALETQLETVIVTSEIHSSVSELLLRGVLQDHQRDDEVRAGAAWALGQFSSKTSAEALIETFNESPLDIKTEAARALLRIATPQIDYLVDLLKSSTPDKRDGLSWVLARTGHFDPTEILNVGDDNLRRWASYILGHGKERFIEANVQSVLAVDPQVYFAASVLWQILASWINDLKEY